MVSQSEHQYSSHGPSIHFTTLRSLCALFYIRNTTKCNSPPDPLHNNLMPAFQESHKGTHTFGFMQPLMVEQYNGQGREELPCDKGSGPVWAHDANWATRTHIDTLSAGRWQIVVLATYRHLQTDRITPEVEINRSLRLMSKDRTTETFLTLEFGKERTMVQNQPNDKNKYVSAKPLINSNCQLGSTFYSLVRLCSCSS